MTECERIIKEGILPKSFFEEEVRCDFHITEERKKSILFSEPTYIADDVVVITDKALIDNKGFLADIKEGFDI